MAPSPQHDSEPKAPDKSGAAAAQPAVDHRAPPSPAPAGVQLAESKHVGGLDAGRCARCSTRPSPTSVPRTARARASFTFRRDLAESKHVGGLDDGALRALLDEAITYKCPKDREGKSLLFKELLEEAEQDEEACGGGGGGGGGWRGGREAARGRRGGGRRGERLPHSGSLQDLVAAALAADVPPQRRRPHAPVSARTHHGGSLPSGVDRSFLLGEEPVRGAGGGGGGADYIATVRCVNPPPLTERRVSVSDAHNATEMELLNRSKIPCIPVTYTSRATLDISGGGRAHTTTTCSNQVRTPRAPTASTARPSASYREGKTSTVCSRENTTFLGSVPCDDTESSSANRLLGSLEKPMLEKKGLKKRPRKFKTSEWDNSPRICLKNDTPSTIFAPALLYEPSGSVDQKLSEKPFLLKEKNIPKKTQKLGNVCQENTPGKHLTKTDTFNSLSSCPSVPYNTSNEEDKNIAKKPQKPGKSCQENALGKDIKETATSNPLSSSPAVPCNTSNVEVKNITKKPQKPGRFCPENAPGKHLKETAASNQLSSSPAVPYNTSNVEDKNIAKKPQKPGKFCKKNAPSKHLKETATSIPLSSNPAMPYSTSNDCTPHIRREAPVTVNKNNKYIGDQFQGDIFSNESLKKISDSIALNFHVGYPSGPFCINRFDSQQNTTLENSRNVQSSQESYPKFYPENCPNNTLNQNSRNISQNIDQETVYGLSCSRQPFMQREPTIGPPEVLFSRRQCPARVPVGRKLLRETESLRFQKDPEHSKLLPFVLLNTKTDLNLNVKNTTKLEPSIGESTNKPKVTLDTINEDEDKMRQIVVHSSDDDYDEPIQCSIRKNGSHWEYPKSQSYTSQSSSRISTADFDKISLCTDAASPGSLNVDMDAFIENAYDVITQDIDNASVESEVYKCTQAVNLYKKYLTKSDNSNKVVASESNLSAQPAMDKSDTAKNDCAILHLRDKNIVLQSDLLNVSAEKTIDHESEKCIVPIKEQAVKHFETECSSCDTGAIDGIQINSDSVGKSDPSKLSEVDVGDQTYRTPIQLDPQIKLHIIDELQDVPKQLLMSRSAVLLNLVRHHYGNNTSVVMHINNGGSSSDTSFNIQKTTEQVDSGITFGCITTPAVVTSCNTTSSAPSPCASVDSKPRAGGALAAGSINGLAALSRNYGGCSTADEFKKSLDENGNALQTFNSTLSGSSQHKKPRRKKSSKNETVAMSEQIDGYQGNKEISELLRFIESDAEHGRAHKHKPHDKRSGERRARDKAKLQRANSMEELSLSKLEDLTHDKGRGEPLALRKHKKERVSDGGAPDARKSERRSWGDESRAPFYHSNSEEPPSPAAPSTAAAAAPAVAARDKKKPKSSRAAEWPPEAEAPVETLEFQTVTKKKRTRKRHSPQARGGGGGGERAGDLYRKMRPSTPERRRKSAPPSDKSSNDDDLDSVHSLPAEPTAERCAARPGSASSGGTPQASYADIARTRHNIPDLIESCNFYTDLEPLAADDAIGKKDVCRSDSAPVETRRTPPKASDDSSGPAYDAENYPALESRGPRIPPRTKDTKHAEAKPTPVKSVERKPKSEEVSAAEERSAAVERREAAAEAEAAADVSAEPPDVVLAPDRRPPVILLDEASRPREMDGITFGFDINEQLLNGGEREEAPFPSSDEFPAINEKRARARCDLVRECGAEAVAVAVGGRAPLRYVPPAPLAHPHHHHLNRIVNYVGAAWEDIMKCPGGEVRYFSQ